MTGMANWRSRFFALAIALAANLIILYPILTIQDRNLWTRDAYQHRDAIITFTRQQDLDRFQTRNSKSPPGPTRTPNLNRDINNEQRNTFLPSATEPAPEPRSTPAPASQSGTASSATSAVSAASAAVRKALQGLAACSASRTLLASPEQRDACQREYAKAPSGVTSDAFIDPLERARFDAVAKAQEAKRAMMLGPIPDGYVACTGSRSNAMFGCPPPPRPKMPAANLWEASAPSTNSRGDP